MTEIRFIEADELAAYRHAITRGFGGDPDDEPTDGSTDDSTDDDELERFAVNNSAETSIAAFDRGHVVATFGSYDLQLTVPGGGTVAMAGTTHVTVHPTHRRRGILTEMMRLHLDQAVELGQPAAGLWASEERIYGRFGFGPAAFGQELTIADYTVEGPRPDPDVTVHPLTAEEAATVLPPLYERYRVEVPGSLVRTDNWWEHRLLHEPRRARGSDNRQRFVMAERAGEPVGYVVFRLKAFSDWGQGRTDIIGLVGVDDAARRALWNFAANVDLYRNVRWWNAPIDDPLLVGIDRFREVKRQLMDTLWLRPLDVAALLEGRHYERDGVSTVAVVDRFGPAGGTYRLEVAEGLGQVKPSDDEPQITLAVEDLGRLLLGGVSVTTLARAGLVDGTTADVATLDDLVRTRVPPHCPEVF